MTTNTTTTISIIAQALTDNRNFKNARVDGTAVGVANARQWKNAVLALRMPAYSVRQYRHAHMGDDSAPVCDQTPLYNALAPVLELVGPVNGVRLNVRTIAEEVISNSVRIRAIDTSPEMAHARSMKKLAAATVRDIDNYEITLAEAERNLAQWTDEVKVLESMPGNCKKIQEIQSETAFIKAVELLLGDAITKQLMKTPEQVAAEEAARKAERKEARRNAQRAKRASK